MTSPVSILVVDDEPPLRRLMQAFLERIGYAVKTCENAASTLKLIKEQPGEFSLAVMDLSLPDMDGQELALQIMSVEQELRVLFCSGYPFELSTLPENIRDRVGVLQKPFLPNMLVSAVDELLKR